MEKEIIITNVGEILGIDTDYDCGDKPTEIDEIINLLTQAQIGGATHVRMIGSGYDGGCDSLDIVPVKVVLESDEAFENRKKAEETEQAWNNAQRENREKEQLRVLKLKYPNA